MCPNGGACSGATYYTEYHLGSRAEYGYYPVGQIDISNQLAAGGIFTINLVDTGGLYASTEIDLTNTNCTLVTAAPVDTDGGGIPDTCDINSHPGAVDFDNDGIVDSSNCDTQIGPPTSKDQCKNGGFMNFNFPRTFKNQGDCIQFVNTGK